MSEHTEEEWQELKAELEQVNWAWEQSCAAVAVYKERAETAERRLAMIKKVTDNNKGL